MSKMLNALFEGCVRFRVAHIPDMVTQECVTVTRQTERVPQFTTECQS